MEDNLDGDLFGDVDDLLFDFPGSDAATDERPFVPFGPLSGGALPTQFSSPASAAEQPHPSAPAAGGGPSPSSSAADHAADDSKAKRKAEQNRCQQHFRERGKCSSWRPSRLCLRLSSDVSKLRVLLANSQYWRCQVGGADALRQSVNWLILASVHRRRAYQRYRERQRQQKDADRRAMAALEDRLRAMELVRSQLAQRVEVLQKVGAMTHPRQSCLPTNILTPPRPTLLHAASVLQYCSPRRWAPCHSPFFSTWTSYTNSSAMCRSTQCGLPRCLRPLEQKQTQPCR